MMMVIMVIEVVEDDSASSVKGGGVFLSFRRAGMESSVVFEANKQISQERTANFPQALAKDREDSRFSKM